MDLEWVLVVEDGLVAEVASVVAAEVGSVVVAEVGSVVVAEGVRTVGGRREGVATWNFLLQISTPTWTSTTRL